jgi:hypothetical protein
MKWCSLVEMIAMQLQQAGLCFQCQKSIAGEKKYNTGL